MSVVSVDLDVVRVGLLGYGGVGQSIARIAASSEDRLAGAGVAVECVSAFVRDRDKPRPAPRIPLVTDPRALNFDDVDVVVEVLGGIEPARSLVARALEAGVPVVTANKSLVAAHGPELLALAARRGTSLLFEAAVLAGVPCVNTLARRPLASGTGRIAGILNGTSHFILSAMDRGETFDEALAQATRLGYAEPAPKLTDGPHAPSLPSADVSGQDAAEKLTILLHLSGYADVVVGDLRRTGIDGLEAWHLNVARRLGGRLKPVALASAGLNPGAWVGPAFVPESHAFARLDGVTNALAIGHGDREVLFIGPGAGPDATAATVLDDVVEAVSGGRPRSPRRVSAASVRHLLRTPPDGAWFLAIDDSAIASGDLAEFLAALRLPALSVAESGSRLGVVTAPASHAVARGAVDALEATGLRVRLFPVLEADGRG